MTCDTPRSSKSVHLLTISISQLPRVLWDHIKHPPPNQPSFEVIHGPCLRETHLLRPPSISHLITSPLHCNELTSIMTSSSESDSLILTRKITRIRPIHEIHGTSFSLVSLWTTTTVLQTLSEGQPLINVHLGF